MRPNSQRAKNAITALIAAMIVMTIAAFIHYITVNVKLSETARDIVSIIELQNKIRAYTILHGISSLILAGVYITCIVLFIKWFRRAYFNLHRLVPSSRLTYTEGWAAGAWFVPIFNLFGPFQIATDLFKQSERVLIENKLMDRQENFHQVKNWWWGLWIASGVFERVAVYMERRMEVFEFGIAKGISIVLMIGAGILAIQMIKNYSKMEELLKQVDLHDESNVSMITDDDLLDSGI